MKRSRIARSQCNNRNQQVVGIFSLPGWLNIYGNIIIYRLFSHPKEDEQLILTTQSTTRRNSLANIDGYANKYQS